MQLAWVHILTVRILQQLAHILDVHHFTVTQQHLGITLCMTADNILLGPVQVHLVKVFCIVIRLLGLLKVRPIHHLHVVRVHVVKEHRHGRFLLLLQQHLLLNSG